MRNRYRSKTCKDCAKYEEIWQYGNPPDDCTYCKRFYCDLFKKGTESD